MILISYYTVMKGDDYSYNDGLRYTVRRSRMRVFAKVDDYEDYDLEEIGFEMPDSWDTREGILDILRMNESSLSRFEPYVYYEELAEYYPEAMELCEPFIKESLAKKDGESNSDKYVEVTIQVVKDILNMYPNNKYFPILFF